MSTPETGGRVAIVVDSAASLPPGATEHPLLSVVPMNVTFGDRSFRDGVDLNITEFYRELERADAPPTTAAAAPGGYVEAFQEASRVADSVLCLTVASAFSSSYDSAKMAVEEVRHQTPGLTVEVIDSQTAVGGEGLVALEALRSAERGNSLAEVADAARVVVERVTVVAFLDTLFYLWKGGRVPRIAHAATSLLRIKPVFELSRGEVKTVSRPRTKARAMRRLVDIIARRRPSDGTLHATVMHADGEEAAEELRGVIEAGFRCEELFVSECTPVIGAHVGPGLVGVAMWWESPCPSPCAVRA